MLSLSPFSNKSVDRRAGSLDRILSVFLHGIGDCAARGGSAETAALQTTLRNLRDELEHAENEEAKMAAATAILRNVEEFNGRLERRETSRRQELNGTISLLMKAVAAQEATGPESAAELRELETEILAATDSAALTPLRSRLDDCLVSLRQQVLHPAPAAEIVEKQIRVSDPVTGLPGAEQALDDISNCWHRRDHLYAVIFEADRIETINTRYGYSAGDQVLLLISQHIAQNLAPTDHLYRWRGPFLVALIERSIPEIRITTELQRLVSARLEHAISIRDREVTVPVSISWNMLPLVASRTPEEIAARADQYMASRLRPPR